MPLEIKELKAGLAFIQDGKRVAMPKAGNYAVRPVAGGLFIKANGVDTVKELRAQFPGCQFLWLSNPFDAKADKSKEDDTAKDGDKPKTDN